MPGFSIQSDTSEGFYTGESSKLLNVIKLFTDNLNDEFEKTQITTISSQDLLKVKKRIEAWIDLSLTLRNNIIESSPSIYIYKNKEVILYEKSSALDSLLVSVFNFYSLVSKCISENESLKIKRVEL